MSFGSFSYLGTVCLGREGMISMFALFGLCRFVRVFMMTVISRLSY